MERLRHRFAFRSRRLGPFHLRRIQTIFGDYAQAEAGSWILLEVTRGPYLGTHFTIRALGRKLI